MTGNRPYDNQSSQRERRAVLRNDREATTYHAFAQAEADVPRGRFTAEIRSQVMPARYPKLPENSPWARDLVGQEPPLNQDVSAVEPVGTHAEIEQSLLREVRDGGVAPTTPLPELSHSGDAQRADVGTLQPRVRRLARRRRSSKQGEG